MMSILIWLLCLRKETKMTDVEIARINELYHKSKAEGLTEEEKAEQAALRKAYIADIKGSIKAQMSNIDILNADGSVSNVGKMHDERK